MKGLLIIAFALALAAPIGAADTKGTPADEAAIRSLLAAYTTAFNHHDVNAVVMLHTESAELVQRSGIYLKGRAELEQQYTKIFKGIFADRPPGPEPKWVSIRFVRPDVAIIHGTGDATLNPDVATFVVTYVVTKEDGKWLIAAQNNNPVVSSVLGPNRKP